MVSDTAHDFSEVEKVPFTDEINNSNKIFPFRRSRRRDISGRVFYQRIEYTFREGVTDKAKR